MARRKYTREIKELRRRDLAAMRRHRKRGERQKFRSEVRPFLAA